MLRFDSRGWLEARGGSGVPPGGCPLSHRAVSPDVASTRLVVSRTWQPPAELAPTSPGSVQPSRRRPVAILAGAAALAAGIGAGTACAIGSAGTLRGHALRSDGRRCRAADSHLRQLRRAKARCDRHESRRRQRYRPGHSPDLWTATGAAGEGTLGTVPAACRLAGGTGDRAAGLGAPRVGFGSIQCWKDGGVAEGIGDGDGTFVFLRPERCT